MMITRWHVCSTSGRICVDRHHRVFARQVLDQLADFMNLFRIQTDRGLVENQNRRIIRAAPARCPTRCLYPLDSLAMMRSLTSVIFTRSMTRVTSLASWSFGHAFDLRYETAGSRSTSSPRYSGRIFGQVSNPAANVERLFEDVESVHLHAPIRCRHVSGDNPHGGCFARAVGSEESENLSLFTSNATSSIGGFRARSAS